MKKSIYFLDIILILIVLFAGGISLFFLLNGGENKDVVKISCFGREIFYPLSQDREILVENNGYSLIVAIENRQVYVKNSTCPGHDCEDFGKIGLNSRGSIVCIPCGVIIIVIGKERLDEDKDEPDFIAR